MKLFNIFKQKEKETPPQKIEFNQLKSYTKDRIEQEKMKERSIILDVKTRISKLVPELKKKMELVKKVDVQGKKVEETYKSIVIDSRAKYLNCLDILIENLESLNDENLEKMTYELNRQFIEFDKKTRMLFDKTTILIGKEMVEIKDLLNQFLKYSGEAINNNKEIVHNLRVLNQIENKQRKIEVLEKENLETLNARRGIDQSISQLKSIENLCSTKIDEITKSEDYLKEKKNKEAAQNNKKELDGEIIKIKIDINFKHLEKIYHTNEKKMNLIKEYNHNFNQIIYNEDISDLISLMDEKEKEKIIRSIKVIKTKSEELNKIINLPDKVNDKKIELENIKNNIKNLESDKLGLNKKIEKLDVQISLIKKDISTELEKIKIITV